LNATVFTELRDELEAGPELEDPAELKYAAAPEEDSSPGDAGLSALARESDRKAAPKMKTPNRILISLN
jgi:hypothetical protein